MGQATAIYNFLRNIGGSVGVAFITTILARRAQFHQARMVDHLTPFDTSYSIAKDRISEMLSGRGLDTVNPDSIIYGQLQRQSHMLAFNDTFLLMSITMVAVFSLVFLMKRVKEAKGPGGTP